MMGTANQQQMRASSDVRSRLTSILTSLVVSNLVLGTLILLFIGIVLLVIGYTLSLPPSLRFITDLSKQIGGGVLVIGVVIGLLRLLILGSYNKFVNKNDEFLQDDVQQHLQEVETNIKQQTDSLMATVASLKAMSALNIQQMYAKRRDAGVDIEQDMQAPGISHIYIVGISLNDFIGGDQYFNTIWTKLQGYVTDDGTLPQGTSHLDIKILIIDPHSYGAHLRSFGENRRPGGPLSRLYNDVTGMIKDLEALEKTALQKKQEALQKNQQPKVSFEFRLYRTPPLLFLFATDKVSYIEPYYFWPTRTPEASMPVFRCSSNQGSETNRAIQLHTGMREHFKLLWEHASVHGASYRESHAIGVDEGLYQCGIVNIFQDPREARPRILYLLKQAKQRIFIQGVSLHSYFDGYELNAAINDHLEDPKSPVEIKVLLLNPDAEQAKYRSYREYLLNNPQMKREDYWNDPKLHEDTDLYKDTQRTKRRIDMMNSKNNRKIDFRLYDSAPACFLLLIDDTVFIEQYHYGSLHSSRVTTVNIILGEDTAVVEYKQPDPQRPNLYADRLEIDTIGLMENHFDFVFQQCADTYAPSPAISGLNKKL